MGPLAPKRVNDPSTRNRGYLKKGKRANIIRVAKTPEPTLPVKQRAIGLTPLRYENKEETGDYWAKCGVDWLLMSGLFTECTELC